MATYRPRLPPGLAQAPQPPQPQGRAPRALASRTTTKSALCHALPPLDGGSAKVARRAVLSAAPLLWATGLAPQGCSADTSPPSGSPTMIPTATVGKDLRISRVSGGCVCGGGVTGDIESMRSVYVWRGGVGGGGGGLQDMRIKLLLLLWWWWRWLCVGGGTGRWGREGRGGGVLCRGAYEYACVRGAMCGMPVCWAGGGGGGASFVRVGVWSG